MFSIENFPVSFYSLVDVFNFLLSVPESFLYRFSEQVIYFDSIPVMWILLHYQDGVTYVSYKDFPSA